MINIKTTVEDMSNLLEEHSIIIGGVNHLTSTGWNMLSEEFGRVPEELRMSVYSDFTRELTRRGVDYDESEFKNGVTA